MELPDDAAKLPKLPFILGDIVFLGVAAYLINQAGSPPSTASIVGIVVCAGIGVALGVAPFIVDYARLQHQQLTERQNALEALVRTTSSAADQAGIAAHGLHEIAEITKRNLHTIDELPARIEAARQSAKTKENHQHATAVEALRGDVEQLREEQAGSAESTTQLLEKLVEQLADQETRWGARLSKLEDLIQTAPAPTTASVGAPAAEIPAPPDDTAAPVKPAVEAPVDEDAETEATDDSAPPDEAPAEPKPKPKTKPRKSAAKPPPPPEPSLFDESETNEVAEVFELDEAATVDEVAPSDAASEDEPDFDALDNDEESDADDEPTTAPAPASDGITRITITAYIGIGNRLFVRGDGPGLSPDEGTPLQFVSIGKWRWETDAATAPMKLTVWKNDVEPCTALGEIELKPGAQLETNANF